MTTSQKRGLDSKAPRKHLRRIPPELRGQELTPEGFFNGNKGEHSRSKEPWIKVENGAAGLGTKRRYSGPEEEEQQERMFYQACRRWGSGLDGENTYLDASQGAIIVLQTCFCPMFPVRVVSALARKMLSRFLLFHS